MAVAANKRRLSLNLRDKMSAINETIELGDSVSVTLTDSQGGSGPRSKRWSLGTPYSSRKLKQLLSDDFTENTELDKLKQAALLKPLESATLEDLLQELVTNSRKDSMFGTYFLLTSEYLLSNAELVAKIIELYPRQVSEREDQYSTKMRTVNTLSKLMNIKSQIKESPECMRMIRDFAGDLSDGNQVDRDVSAVLYKRMSHVTSPGKEDSPVASRRRSNSMYSGLKSIRFDIIEDTARDIAEQFTLVSFESFKRIPMEILIKKRFEKETDSNDTPLGRFVGFFNDSSRWICTQIVMATSEERPQRIAKFIMVMRELWSLSNFNGVMIFYSALNNGAISKLMDRIVPNLPEDVIQSFEEVKKLMDHRLNFKNYRDELESAPAPCIPYIALMLRDLMHLEELDTREEDDRINWHKLSSIGKILYKFTYYQTASYEFMAIPHIQRYFVNFQRSTILNESELYELGRVVSNFSSTSSIDTSRSSASDNAEFPPDEDVESSEEEDEPSDVMQGEGLYPLPPWVLKREVTTSLGNLRELNTIVSERTVLFVFLRHFGCIMCRKSAAELMMIKPHLDKLGVKLVAVSTGNPAQAKAFKEEFKFEGEVYVDEARHLYDDFRCQRGWIKGVLNPKTQAMNAEARALGYSQGPIEGDILQLGGAFILKNGGVMYEHIEKYAGDLADPVDILKRLGACTDTIELVYTRHPQLRPKMKVISKKIRSLESKRKKVVKKLRRLSDKTPDLLKADTSSATLNRRRWSEKLIQNKRKSLEIDLNKDKEELVKKRHKYNQIKEKEMILELKIEKCRNKQVLLTEENKEEKKVSETRLRKAVY